MDLGSKVTSQKSDEDKKKEREYETTIPSIFYHEVQEVIGSIQKTIGYCNARSFFIVMTLLHYLSIWTFFYRDLHERLLPGLFLFYVFYISAVFFSISDDTWYVPHKQLYKHQSIKNFLSKKSWIYKYFYTSFDVCCLLSFLAIPCGLYLLLSTYIDKLYEDNKDELLSLFKVVDKKPVSRKLVPTQMASTTQDNSVAGQLERLVTMKNAGSITDSEFQKAKALVLKKEGAQLHQVHGAAVAIPIGNASGDSKVFAPSGDETNVI